MNTKANPLQAFKETSTTGVNAGGIYFSEEIVQEKWFIELRRLCHKRNLALFNNVVTPKSITKNPEEESKEEGGEEQAFSGLADLAALTNRQCAHKMTKNNYKKVII